MKEKANLPHEEPFEDIDDDIQLKILNAFFIVNSGLYKISSKEL